jgi:hypothetical protein
MSATPGIHSMSAVAAAWTSGMIILMSLLTAACKPAPPSQALQDSADLAPQKPHPVAALPLPRGYYVASDTPCAQASNATLLLLRRHSMGGARDFCEFKSIQQIDPATYLVEEMCADFQGSDSVTRQMQYTLEGNNRFVSKDQNGIVHDARYCAQSGLPPDWRSTDIRAEIE